MGGEEKQHIHNWQLRCDITLQKIGLFIKFAITQNEINKDRTFMEQELG